MTEILRFNDFSYAYQDAGRQVLLGISLGIRSGECHCLGGVTGCGKTSLALAAKGLLTDGRVLGAINRCETSHGPDRGIGIVLQNPETQLLTGSVGSEIAFGLENQGRDPQGMTAMIRTALLRVGLEKPLGFETAKLSMGEKYRLLLACQLAMNPRLLILDEPAAQLDPEGLAKLTTIVYEMKKEGVALLLCENEPGPLQDAIDRHWHLAAGGTLHPGPAPVQTRSMRFSVSSPHKAPGIGETAIRVSDMAVNDTAGRPIWSDVSFLLPRGRRAALYGLNGAGKTTLLRCLLGFAKPSCGEVRIFGKSPDPSSLRGRVGCLFQNPQRQLFETTVFDEVAFPVKRLQKAGAELKSRVHETLCLCRIEELADRSPHTLSYGQKHLVALASVIAMEPTLMILDDPFAGLDPKLAAQVLELLTSLNQEKGTTLLLTSHAPGSLGDWTDITLSLAGGKLVCH
jgi:energy-coupling factor transport system ATP-binding protein